MKEGYRRGLPSAKYQLASHFVAKRLDTRYFMLKRVLAKNFNYFKNNNNNILYGFQLSYLKINFYTLFSCTKALAVRPTNNLGSKVYARTWPILHPYNENRVPPKGGL